MNFTPLHIAPDVSFYEDDNTTIRKIDFVKMKSNGAVGVGIRMGQGKWIDEDFMDFHASAKAAGLPRFEYLFYDPRIDPVFQANLLVNLIGNDPPEWGIWLDLEYPASWGGAYNQESDWRKCLEQIKVLYSGVVGIYTANWWWQAQTVKDPAYWGRHPLWVAQYTNDPLFVTLPKPWAKAVLWQYTDKGNGPAYGTESLGVDLNYTSQDFYNLFKPSATTSPFPGIQRVSGSYMGWKYELFIIQPNAARYEVTYTPALETVSKTAKRKGAALAFNGGEWDRVSSPKDYTVSNGFTVVQRNQAVPSLHVMKDGEVVISHQTLTGVQQAISGLRYLLRDGAIQPYLFGTEPQYTEGHARSIHGTDVQGNHLILTSEGIYPNQGLTLLQCATLLQAYGANLAFDSGGGGDAEVVLNGQVLTTTENISNGVHFERPLPTALLIYPKGVNNMNGTAKEALGNTSTVRKTPSRYGTGVYSLPANGTIEFIEDVPVVISGPLDTASDKWLKLTDGNFVNHILSGKTYYNILTQPTTPAPPPPPATDKMVVSITKDGVTTTYTSTGTITIS